MKTRQCVFDSDGIRLERRLHLVDCAPLTELTGGQHLDWIQPGHSLSRVTIPRIVDWFRRYPPVGQIEEHVA